MEYWSSLPWKASLSSSKESDSTVALDLPFALIGSHRACNVRINKGRGPELAYVAFSFADAVEVWPLCALAFSQWGTLAEDQILRVGRTSVFLNQEGKELSRVENGQDEEPGPEQLRSNAPPILQVNYRGQKGSFALDRRVVILGNDHPSTRRLHGVGLSCCDQAVVSVGQNCWLINLNPRNSQSIQELVREVPVDGKEIKVGKIKVACRLPTEKEAAKLKSSSSKDLPLSSQRRNANPVAIPDTLDVSPETGGLDSAPSTIDVTEPKASSQPRFDSDQKIPDRDDAADSKWARDVPSHETSGLESSSNTERKPESEPKLEPANIERPGQHGNEIPGAEGNLSSDHNDDSLPDEPAANALVDEPKVIPCDRAEPVHSSANGDSTQPADSVETSAEADGAVDDQSHASGLHSGPVAPTEVPTEKADATAIPGQPEHEGEAIEPEADPGPAKLPENKSSTDFRRQSEPPAKPTSRVRKKSGRKKNKAKKKRTSKRWSTESDVATSGQTSNPTAESSDSQATGGRPGAGNVGNVEPVALDDAKQTEKPLGVSTATTDAVSTSRNQPSSPPATGSPKNPQTSEDVESVASSVTDRMVSREQSKWWKRPVVKFSVIATVFLLSLGVLLGIVIKYVLPNVFQI